MIANHLVHMPKSSSLIFGVVSGIVTNNKDPEGLGRVKVMIPRISSEDESNWARIVSFMAGHDRGGVFIPEVDDEVLVAFEYGNITMPYVIGALWNGQDSLPVDNQDGNNDLRIIKSRSGHIIKLNDKEGEESIEIMDKSHKNFVKINTKDNTISITADKDLVLSAKNGSLILNSPNIEMKATQQIDIKGDQAVNVKGQMINLN